MAHRRRVLVSDEVTLVEINEDATSVELAEGRNQTELRNEASRKVAKAAVLLTSTSTECKSESVPTDSRA